MVFQCRMAFVFASLFWFHFSFANYVACPRIQEVNQMPRCGLSGMAETGDNSVFRSCVPHQFAVGLHLAIQQTIREECQVEQRIRQAEQAFEHGVAQANAYGGIPPNPPDPSEYEREIMFRLDGSYAPRNSAVDAMQIPARTDSCLTELDDYLEDQATNLCGVPSVYETCAAATSKAQAAKAKFDEVNLELAGMQSDAEAASREGGSPAQTGNGILPTYRRVLSTMATQLNEVKAANIACSDSLVELESNGCLSIYTDYFGRSDIQEAVANNCTHSGLNAKIDEYVRFMQDDPISPAVAMKALSTNHIRNRTEEENLAAAYEIQFTSFAAIEAQLTGRGTASVEPTGGE